MASADNAPLSEIAKVYGHPTGSSEGGVNFDMRLASFPEAKSGLTPVPEGPDTNWTQEEIDRINFHQQDIFQGTL